MAYINFYCYKYHCILNKHWASLVHHRDKNSKLYCRWVKYADILQVVTTNITIIIIIIIQHWYHDYTGFVSLNVLSIKSRSWFTRFWMDWRHVTLDRSPASLICQVGALSVPQARTVFTFHLSGCPRSSVESSPLPDLTSRIIYRSTSHLLELNIHSVTGWRRTCFNHHIPNIYQFTSKFYCHFLLQWTLQWFSPLRPL